MVETYLPRETEAQTYGFHQIPRSVVSDIIINPHFEDPKLDARLSLWTQNEPYLLSSACVIATPTSKGPIKLMQHPSGFRTAILKSPLTTKERPYEDDNGVRYGLIDAKGIGITPNCSSNFKESIHSSPDPIGFFGYNDAVNDMNIGDAFATHGGRTARTLAIIALDHQRLYGWLKTIPYSDVLIENLAKVINNNDVPVIAVRLLGTERMQDFLEKNPSSPFYSKKNIVQRTAVLLLSEITSRGYYKFLDRYRFEPRNNFHARLSSLADTGLSKPGLDALQQLYVHFFRWNRLVASSAHDKFPKQVKPDIREHNIDLSGFWYDWEGSHPDNDQYNHASLQLDMQAALSGNVDLF